MLSWLTFRLGISALLQSQIPCIAFEELITTENVPKAFSKGLTKYRIDNGDLLHCWISSTKWWKELAISSCSANEWSHGKTSCGDRAKKDLDDILRISCDTSQYSLNQECRESSVWLESSWIFWSWKYLKCFLFYPKLELSGRRHTTEGLSWPLQNVIAHNFFSFSRHNDIHNEKLSKFTL